MVPVPGGDSLGLGAILVRRLLLVSNFDAILALRLFAVILFLLLVLDFHRLGGLLIQFDGEGDELGVALDQFLKVVLSRKLCGVILQEHGDLSTSAQSVATWVRSHTEGRVGSRLPHMLLVVVVLGDDTDLVSNQVHRVETTPN